jgi:hypothetical protein
VGGCWPPHHFADQQGLLRGLVHPDNGVTVSTNDRHREHHAVTVSTKQAVHVLIHSDIYVLKISDAEQSGSYWRSNTRHPADHHDYQMVMARRWSSDHHAG